MRRRHANQRAEMNCDDDCWWRARRVLQCCESAALPRDELHRATQLLLVRPVSVSTPAFPSLLNTGTLAWSRASPYWGSSEGVMSRRVSTQVRALLLVADHQGISNQSITFPEVLASFGVYCYQSQSPTAVPEQDLAYAMRASVSEQARIACCGPRVPVTVYVASLESVSPPTAASGG